MRNPGDIVRMHPALPVRSLHYGISYVVTKASAA